MTLSSAKYARCDEEAQPMVPVFRSIAYLVALFASTGACAFAQAAPADSPVPTPDSGATPIVYGYTFTPPAPSAGTPRFLSVELNSDHLRAGGPIAIRVSTTSDVVKVTTGNGKHSGTLTQSGPGVFTSDSSLPHIGGFASVRIKLHFEATTADGTSISLDVPVSYR
jgi:hypothetical protein